MNGPKELIDKLHKNQELSLEEWTELIKNRTPELSEYLFELAREERHKYYGHDVYVRGLIEFTNYCRNDCLYCGIRKSNAAAHRYRLDEDTILRCCQEGYDLGFRTFVLQGGEDGYFTEERIIHIVRRIREHFPQCAITLSIGEWKKDSYQAFFDAGADRYLYLNHPGNRRVFAENNLQNQSQSGLECFCHSAYCLLCGSLSHLQISLRLVLYFPSPLWNEG